MRRPLKAARSVLADYFWRCWRTDTLPISSAPSASRRTFLSSLIPRPFIPYLMFGGRQSQSSSCCVCGKFHHLLLSGRNAQPSRRRDDSNLNSESAYNIHSKRARALDAWELVVPKPMRDWKEKSSRPIRNQAGLLWANSLSATRNYFQPTPRMLCTFYLGLPPN